MQAHAVGRFITATLTADDTCSPTIKIGTGTYRAGVLVLKGTWVADVKLMRQDPTTGFVDATDNQGTMIKFTKNGTYTINEPVSSVLYKFCTETYTSGSIVGYIETE